MRLKINLDKGLITIFNDLLDAGEIFENNNTKNKKPDWRHSPWTYLAEMDEEELSDMDDGK